MNDQINFYYDEFSDRLMISCKKDSEKVIGSMRILNITIDFTSNTKPVNVEFRNFSEYLGSIGINKDIIVNLKKLKNVDLSFKQYRDGLMIYITLKTENLTERIPYNIPMKKPISC